MRIAMALMALALPGCATMPNSLRQLIPEPIMQCGVREGAGRTPGRLVMRSVPKRKGMAPARTLRADLARPDGHTWNSWRTG